MNQLTNTVRLEIKDQIGIIITNNPPVNALGHSVRKGIFDGIQLCEKEENIRTIIIICEGRTFFAGADIKEFGKPMAGPKLGEVLNKIEACNKPVIAAIHGTALGGGLETALSCHYRVAVKSAKLGLPEVKLGLLPGAGGTQRLPRVIGPEKALEMIAFGNPISAQEAFEYGLVDLVVEQDLLKETIEYAKELIARGAPPRRTSQLTEKIEKYQGRTDIFENFKKKYENRFRGQEAPYACIEAVKAALEMNFEDGLRYERQLFEKLMRGTQSKALRYYFFAERKATKIPGIGKDTPILNVKKAGIVGLGKMGRLVAMTFAEAGIPVTVVDVNEDALQKGLNFISRTYENQISEGKLTKEYANQRMSLINGTVDYEPIEDVDIVVEVVSEDINLKKEVFSKLDLICKKDAIFATATAYLDINDIASSTKRPEYVVGLHFFGAADFMRLLEIVKADKTSDAVIATCLKLAKKFNKKPVVVGVCYGFAANRMFEALYKEAERCILDGSSVEQVERVFYEFGFPMGPFKLMELIGIDIDLEREGSTHSTMISDEDVLKRCLYAVINEGAKILDEKVAFRASDLDVIWVNGFGWPAYKGGPMFWADKVGLDKILDEIKGFQVKFGSHWKPAKLLEYMVKEKKNFIDLNK